MADLKVFQFPEFKGIYNKGSSPPATGTYFTSATNVDIDRAGLLKRRSGYSSILSGKFKSLYPTFYGIIGVKDGDLVYIYPEQGIHVQTLKESVGDNFWVYETIGNRIYASNGIDIGYIEGATWNNLPEVTQTYKHKMPAGHILAYFKGRLYIARDNYVIFSDPAGYHFFDMREDKSFFMRPTRISMIKGVDSGIWLSDQTGIYFLKGDSPDDFNLIQKAEYPAIEGTDRSTPFIMLNGKYPYYNPILFTTKKGICMGSEDGYLVNFTDQSMNIPSANRGCSLVRRDDNLNQFISIIR